MEYLAEVFGLVCSREHCWAPGGEVLPFCQRCTGLYVGAAVAVVLYALFRPRPTSLSLWIHGLLLLVMVPFGYHLVPQNGVLRTLTGQLFAVGLVCYLSLLPTARLSFWGFLERHGGPISRFVLLDHMDWLAGRRFPLLEAEWQAIVDRAAPHARLIWRSAGLRTEYVNRARVRLGGRTRQVGRLLHYHREWAAELHRKCRVQIYGSFHIADLAASPAPARPGPPPRLGHIEQSGPSGDRQDARPAGFSLCGKR